VTRDDDRIEQRPLSLPKDARARPGMFVGAIDSSGVTQLVIQLIDNVLDLHLADRAARLAVSVHDDHFCVRDDGPGVAARDLVPSATASARWRSAAPNARLGLALVNSLARRLEIESCRYGARRRWVFEGFAMVIDGERLGPCGDSGTSVRAWPDPQVFEVCRPDRFALEQRLLGVHRLRPGLQVELDGARFDEPAGIEAWVAGQGCRGAHPVHHIEARHGTTDLELAWAWLPPFGSSRCLSYVNLDETLEDGSHVEGLLAGLARAHGVSVAMARERTLALVSVVAVNPRFSGASRARLEDPALAEWIADLVDLADLEDQGQR
jgi:DNA gyrase subunit B